MTVLGYPSPMQFLSMVLGILIVGLLLGSHFYLKKKRKRRVGWVRGAKSAATGALDLHRARSSSASPSSSRA